MKEKLDQVITKFHIKKFIKKWHGDYEMNVTTVLGNTMEGRGQDNFGDSLIQRTPAEIFLRTPRHE
ncbi:hypothetical protein ACTXT7_003045 [Hymenolepis weldensis]